MRWMKRHSPRTAPRVRVSYPPTSLCALGAIGAIGMLCVAACGDNETSPFVSLDIQTPASAPVTNAESSSPGMAGWTQATAADIAIELKDNAAGFGDKAAPRPVFKTGSESDAPANPNGGGNRAFRHSFINLTVNPGAGNQGAIGIDDRMGL